MDIDNSAYQRERPNIAVLRFWTEYEEVPGQPGDPREVHMCEWVKKGGNGATTCEKVSRIKKELGLWAVVEPYYQAWLKGQEEPTEGTPLSTWPGVHTAQADRLKLLHVRTVEDVANMNDADMDRLGMGARALRDKAKAFVQAKQGQAQIAEALASRDAENAALKAQVEELTATVKQLAAQAGLSEKRGPGRPAKSAA